MGDIYDFIILGAGVSGLNLAKMLSNKGYRVKIIDGYAGPGGNHITKIVDGMEFDIGSIYFNHNDRQFENFPELREACLPYTVLLQKVSATGKVSNYPLSLKTDLFDRGYCFVARTLFSLIRAKLQVKTPTNAAQQLEQKMGRFFLNESGLSKYMHRLLGTTAKDISIDFVDQRMRFVMSYSPVKRIFQRIKLRVSNRQTKSDGSSSLFHAAGGFDQFYEIARQSLEKNGVTFQFSEKLTCIRRCDKQSTFQLMGHYTTYRCQRIISTFPIDRTCDLVGVGRPTLKHVTLVTLMIAYKGEIQGEGDIFFNFHSEAHWKRITIMSNIYGKVDGWDYISVECPLDQDKEIETHELYSEFSKHLRKLKLFKGKMRLVGHHTLSHAYPVLSANYEDEQKRILQKLQNLGIEMAGRQGCFQYIPHSNLAAKLIEAKYASIPESITLRKPSEDP